MTNIVLICQSCVALYIMFLICTLFNLDMFDAYVKLIPLLFILSNFNVLLGMWFYHKG